MSTNFIYDDFITGEKFQNLCDINYSRGLCLPDKDSLVHTPTEFLPYLLEEINNKKSKYKIVCHNTDANIVCSATIRRDNPDSAFYDFVWENIPNNVVTVYAVNVLVEDPRLVPIPIGLENNRWYPDLNKKSKILELIQDPVKKDIRVYLNVNINTNPGVRSFLYSMLESCSWADCVQGHNGYDFNKFIEMIASHVFVLSPEGHGADTHRTWESLYVGSVPVVLRQIFTNVFSNLLPIIVVDNYCSMSYEQLRGWYEQISSTRYNYDILKFAYWRALIK